MTDKFCSISEYEEKKAPADVLDYSDSRFNLKKQIERTGGSSGLYQLDRDHDMDDDVNLSVRSQEDIQIR